MVLKPTAAKNVHKSEVTISATKLSLIKSKNEESEHDHDCLIEMKDMLRKRTAVSESCTSDKWCIQCVTCMSVPEIEKSLFHPMNSCLKWVMVKLIRYEHNYLTFSQFVWSWVTENTWNSRVNMNIIISRENTFPLWCSFFCQSFGLITIYLSTYLNDLLTLTIQTTKDRGKRSKKRGQTGYLIQSLKTLIQAIEHFLPLRIVNHTPCCWTRQKLQNTEFSLNLAPTKSQSWSCFLFILRMDGSSLQYNFQLLTLFSNTSKLIFITLGKF